MSNYYTLSINGIIGVIWYIYEAIHYSCTIDTLSLSRGVENIKKTFSLKIVKYFFKLNKKIELSKNWMLKKI